MPKIKRLVLAGIIAACCSQPARAEDLLQVYRQAQESDPVLKAATASREAAQETKPQARALLLPSVGATVEQGNTFMSVETFDDREGFTFTMQIFTDEKPAYYEFANKTKTMTGAEVFAAFASDANQAKG